MGITLAEAKKRREQYLKTHKESNFDEKNWWTQNLPYSRFLWDEDNAVSLDSITDAKEIEDLKIVYDVPGLHVTLEEGETSFNFIFDAIVESFQVKTIKRSQLLKIASLVKKIDQEKLKVEEVQVTLSLKTNIPDIKSKNLNSKTKETILGKYSRIDFLQKFGKYYPIEDNTAETDANRKDDRFFPFLREKITSMGYSIEIDKKENTLTVSEIKTQRYMGRNVFIKYIVESFLEIYSRLYSISNRNNQVRDTVEDIENVLNFNYNYSGKQKTCENTLDYLMHVYLLGTPESQPVPFYPAPSIYGDANFPKTFFEKYPYHQLFGKVNDRFCIDWFVPTKAKKDFIVFNGRFRVRWLLNKRYIQEIDGETFPGRKEALEEYKQELLNFKLFLNPFIGHTTEIHYLKENYKKESEAYLEKHSIAPERRKKYYDFTIPRLDLKTQYRFKNAQRILREVNLKILSKNSKDKHIKLIFHYKYFTRNLIQDGIGEYAPYVLPMCEYDYKKDFENHIGKPVLYNPLKMLLRNQCTIIETYKEQVEEQYNDNEASMIYI